MAGRNGETADQVPAVVSLYCLSCMGGSLKARLYDIWVRYRLNKTDFYDELI